MQSRQIKIVQSSWQKVLPIAEQFAETFYGKLFALDPKLNQLFTTDMEKQGHKLIISLHAFVQALDDFDTSILQIPASGQPHNSCSTKLNNYDTFGEALIWTLAQGLDEDFNHEVESAWREAYAVVGDIIPKAVVRAA